MKRANDTFPHLGEFIVPPGATLQEAIDDLGMTQADLATRTGLSAKTVNRIIHGHEPLTYETAELLERVTGVPANLWNNLESIYRARLARNRSREELAHAVGWIKGFPIDELVARGAIEKPADDVECAQAVLSFFGVGNREQWEAVWLTPAVAFRKSEVFKGDPEGVATWLRLGERVARSTDCRPFSKDKFVKTLGDIRGLTTDRPDVFVPKMKASCADAGVAVVFVPEIRSIPVSGAAYWLTPEKAIVQMTLRGETDAKFWFTFFHEAGHILKHGKKEKFVDDGDAGGRQENEADKFAETFLIPTAEAKQLPELKTREEIIKFAKAVGVAPGIVVGRLQNMGVLGRKAAENDLKKTFKWNNHDAGVEITIG